ncbi:MAG TPA: PIG-L deacetylase family protein [Tepidisphaeraceae bacterium]|nr:PIG-L deacetylase family protein [Tepidisphaeraceae bacterium]
MASRKRTKFRDVLFRRFIPRDAHSSLRLWLVGSWEDRTPQLISDFNTDPVLVLAPHPDDEVIGPGGTVRRHILAGAPVTVAILTDGRWGGYNADGTLVERRKQESRRAAEILGAPPPVFFDAPDCNLQETSELLARVGKLFTEKKPKYVYLPALSDGHPDHWSTNRLVNALFPTLPREMSRRIILRGYEVWTPALANRYVDITSMVDLKRQAIEAFPSQTSSDDYAAAALGLNRYRSLQHLHGRGYAEAFNQMTADEFRYLFTAASLRHKVPPTPNPDLAPVQRAASFSPK